MFTCCILWCSCSVFLTLGHCVAELVVGVDEGSSSQYSGDNIDLNCVNCVVLNEKLQNMLQEFQSAWSIIALPQEDMTNIHESESTRQPNSVQCGERIQCESSRKWIPVVNNCNRRPQNSVRHLAKEDYSCIPNLTNTCC